MFEECNDIVDPKEFIKMCENDVCNCGHGEILGKNCECDSFASYARTCSLAGVVLDWRTEDHCGDGKFVTMKGRNHISNDFQK